MPEIDTKTRQQLDKQERLIEKLTKVIQKKKDRKEKKKIKKATRHDSD